MGLIVGLAELQNICMKHELIHKRHDVKAIECTLKCESEEKLFRSRLFCFGWRRLAEFTMVFIPPSPCRCINVDFTI
jgi:hypothetical protein